MEEKNESEDVNKGIENYNNIKNENQYNLGSHYFNNAIVKNKNNQIEENNTENLKKEDISSISKQSMEEEQKTKEILENKKDNQSSSINNNSQEGQKYNSNSENSNYLENNNHNSQNQNILNNEILSPEEFTKLYYKMHSVLVENKKLDKLKEELINILESVTEHLINGDKRDPKIFELFCSLNFIQDLKSIMSKKNREINIQIIKFFSVLMTNLSEKHIIYFLFNCDFINQQIYEDNEPIEGDYLYYYISFVKSLMLKININTIGIFFHAQTYSFPLLGNCLKFYNHPDSMISNTIRNIFLFILKINHPPCIDYICTLPMLTYFIFISCRLRDEIKTLNKKIKRNKKEDCLILHEQIISDIMYLQDIFSINIVKINFILINCIFHYLILPVICNSIIYSSDLDNSTNLNETVGSVGRSESFGNFFFKKNNNITSNANNNPLLKHCISSELTLYILNIFLKYIKNNTFINLLISIIFLPKIYHKLNNKLKTPTRDLENYQGDYNSKEKKKISFVKYVTQNFSIPFIKAQINNPYKIFSDFRKIEKTLAEKLKEYKLPYNLDLPVPFGFLLELLNGYFSSRELRECREYHEIISEATGIQCGLSYKFDKKCFIYLMHKILGYIKNDYSFEIIEKKFIDNEINISFINSYKDSNDLFIILSNYFFHQIINNKYACKELLAYVKFLHPEEIYKNIINNIDEENSSALQVGALLESKDKKQKKPFNEVLTFSNFYKVQYKKDFILKEFNLYSNEILSKVFYNGQIEYNSKLFGDIISYINRDTILKPETYLLIVKLINDLIVYERNEELKFLKLRSIHNTIIKNAFCKNIDKIKNIINENEINDNDLKMIHIFLWGNNNLDIFEDYNRIEKNLIKDCLFLLPNENDDDNDDEADKNIIPGVEIYNNLMINNIELKTRIYFLKAILQIYLGINEIKEKDILLLTTLNEENISNVKNIVIDNLNKLIEVGK